MTDPTLEGVVLDGADQKLAKFRQQFQAAVQGRKAWRDKAKRDYEFYYGDQWEESDRNKLKKQKRPAITINRIRPLINLVSGYQRMNRYEPDFLPRTENDIDLCKVRKGVTKYVMDSSKYNRQESRVFLDGAIGGIGWFEVTYDYDYAAMDGKAVIKRVSPFDIYVDPESREPDISDAEYLDRCRWVSKDVLARTYPEHKEEIEASMQRYDVDEVTYDDELEPLWYDSELKKARLIEHWYKEHTVKTYYVLGQGQVYAEDMLPSGVPAAMLQNVQTFRVPQTNIRCATFLGNVLLEDIPSPYRHGRFPYVPYFAYYLGEDDEPAGMVRDLQDLQREENKRRSQFLHLINTMANKGWFVRKGEVEAAKKLKDAGSEPGVVIGFQNEKPTPFDTTQIPTSFVEMEQKANDDFHTVSGINESMLSEDQPSGMSGYAISLRQRQAVTQIAPLFDNLRDTKEQVLTLLWGTPGQPGIIPQFYTEEKTFRIVGDDGQPNFVTVNQRQVTGYDILGNAIYQTLNDLTVGEYDIVISETAATPTQRLAQFYALLELMKVVPPGTVPVDMIIDMSDFPNKEELKQRVQQQQQMIMMQAQQQQGKGPSESINFKDLPPEGKIQMAAQAGIKLSPQGVMMQQAQQTPSQSVPGQMMQHLPRNYLPTVPQQQNPGLPMRQGISANVQPAL